MARYGMDYGRDFGRMERGGRGGYGGSGGTPFEGWGGSWRDMPGDQGWYGADYAGEQGGFGGYRGGQGGAYGGGYGGYPGGYDTGYRGQMDWGGAPGGGRFFRAGGGGYGMDYGMGGEGTGGYGMGGGGMGGYGMGGGGMGGHGMGGHGMGGGGGMEAYGGRNAGYGASTWDVGERGGWRRGAMRAADIMTENPEVVTPDTTLSDVARRMRELDVGIIPVVDSMESRRLRGVITDRDIAVRAVAEGMDGKAKVADCMTTRVSTCNKNDPVEDVMDVMRREQVRRVPITDREGRLVGIIAQADLAVEYAGDDHQRELRVEDTLERISEPGQAGRDRMAARGRGESGGASASGGGGQRSGGARGRQSGGGAATRGTKSEGDADGSR